KNLKEEPHHEMARSLAANDARNDFSKNASEEIVRLTPEPVDRPQGFQEREIPSAEPIGLGESWWIARLNEALSEHQRCAEPDHRKTLEEKIARCRAYLEELQHEQRPKVGAGQ